MTGSIQRSRGDAVWKLAAGQHGVVARHQLLELGFTARAIEHRLETQRLHVLWRSVYAVGRPEVHHHGRLMAATLACGPDAVISHDSAAALWGLLPSAPDAVHISVLAGFDRRLAGIVTHRRVALRPEDVTTCRGIPVTAVVCTLVDLAPTLTRERLERAINEADRRDLATPERVRKELEPFAGRAGVRRLRSILDERTFALTDSELEQRFLPLAREAGLPPPLTQFHLNGFRVDFYWPDLGLVVETDGLRYHRTAAQQARDRLRDQAHTAAGLTVLRFTHGQVRFEPSQVHATLEAVHTRLLNRPPHRGVDSAMAR
jgi:predicted transcriptional regulator of viral defense system